MISASDGDQVRDDGQLFLGAGAEPLSTSRLSWGTRCLIDPVESTDDYLNQEEIGVADDNRKRPAEEETRSGYIADGSALMTINPGSDGGSRLIINDRNSPRPA